jgi:hypothetical protein
MKKIFTLLFATAMLSTAFAQYGQKDQRDRDNNKSNDVYVSNNDHGYDRHNNVFYGGYVFSPRERDMQIFQINREYDYKIQSVKNKYFMSWFQKMRLIRNLEAERDNEIHEVMHKFNSPKNQFGDYGRRDKKRW